MSTGLAFTDITSAERSLLRPAAEMVRSVSEIPPSQLTLQRTRDALLEGMYEADPHTAAHQERVGAALAEVLQPYVGTTAAQEFGFVGETHDIGKANPIINELAHSTDFYPEDSLEKQIIRLHEPIGFYTLEAIGDIFDKNDSDDEARVIRTAALAAGGALKPGSETFHKIEGHELELAGLALHCVDVADALISNGKDRRYRAARQTMSDEATSTPVQILENDITRLYRGNEHRPLPGAAISPLQLAAEAVRTVAKLHQTQI